MLKKLDRRINGLKIRLNLVTGCGGASNQQASPQRNITISNPINTGIGMETLSGRWRSAERLPINLTSRPRTSAHRTRRDE